MIDPSEACPPCRAERERTNRLYAMLSHVNRAIVRAKEPQALYAVACRSAVEYGGFDFAWVGLVEPAGRRIVPAAHAGLPVDAKQIEHAAALGQADAPCPCSQAIDQGQPCVVNDVGGEGGTLSAAWRNFAAKWSLRAVAAFPLRLEGRVIGAFNVMSSKPGIFGTPEVRLLVEVADDISYALAVLRGEEKRAAGESKMQFLAYYDTQTGLPGSALFLERVQEACAEDAAGLALLVVSLRRYHGLLQVLGQAIGPPIARAIASRLEALLPSAAVGRLSESEFAVMLGHADGPHLVEETAWNIQRALAEPVELGANEIFLDPFIGIALWPQDGTPAEMLRNAKLATAWPARDAAAFCRFSSRDMTSASRLQLDTESALRRALDRDEFVLHYQPQLDLVSGRIVGAEALLRWRRPGGDDGPMLVLPTDFIPLLEESGLINAVGEWVLHQACRDSKQWQEAGLPAVCMAVNLSARQYQDGDVKALVRQALAATGLAPAWLELELTEGIVLLNADTVIRAMRDLNADGVTHALDDFGTGYSSLSYLQRLPVSRIKIDRAFIAHVTENPSDAAIVRAIVGMAHSLGLKVIAEGVETEGQLGFVRGLDCQAMQGYLFSRPVPADEFAALLRSGRGLAPAAAEAERVVLLLDDEPNIVAALSRTLRRHGYRILAATGVREGFDLLAAHDIGVVICDQRMPEMTGTEFLRRVKELHPETARIVLSGYTELNSVLDAVNRGAIYKFITKPWDDDVLADSVADAFRIWEIEREHREMSRQLEELGVARRTAPPFHTAPL